MNNCRTFLSVFILEFIISDLCRASDTLQGIGQDTLRFRPRRITGCNGTLMDNFQVTAPTVGNKPLDSRVFLFTKSNNRQPEYLHDCGGNLPDNTNFDPGKQTVVIVHGWLDGTCRSLWLREMRDQLFIRGDYNVILVDWSWGSTPDYAVSASNTRVVGQQLAFVLRNILERSGAHPEDMHIIGHSFGAHIAGFCGKLVPNLGRISALDPALTPFKLSPPEDRLSRYDASLVDVIHSNGVDCALTFGIGSIYPWGHADFYPNGGGPIQLSCYSNILPLLLKGDILNTLSSMIPAFCFHKQSIQFYQVTINPGNCQHIGHECTSYEEFKSGLCDDCGQDGTGCASMGFDFGQGFVKNGTDGYRKYYLDTAFACPYCATARS